MSDIKHQEPLTIELIRLVEHSIWANRQWVEFAFSQPDPKTRPHELLSHIMIGEQIWFERIAGKPMVRTEIPLLDKAELLRGFQENRQTFLPLIPAHLEEIIHFKRVSGEEYHARIADIIHHLIAHGYHHRCQLAAHYARKGVKYPNTDHINFLIVNRL